MEPRQFISLFFLFHVTKGPPAKWSTKIQEKNGERAANSRDQFNARSGRCVSGGSDAISAWWVSRKFLEHEWCPSGQLQGAPPCPFHFLQGVVCRVRSHKCITNSIFFIGAANSGEHINTTHVYLRASCGRFCEREGGRGGRRRKGRHGGRVEERRRVDRESGWMWGNMWAWGWKGEEGERKGRRGGRGEERRRVDGESGWIVDNIRVEGKEKLQNIRPLTNINWNGCYAH